MKRVVGVIVLAASTHALAGGMVLPIRGVRSLERAGAFIAGAEDADALWQNPAGLAHLASASPTATRALLFDLGIVDQTVDYTHIDSGGNPQPRVTNQQGGTPIPTVAGAIAIDDRLVIAGGITAPYAALHKYDDAGPERFASISTAGSSFVIVTVGAAYAITPQLRVGVTLQDLVSTVSSRLVVSACPGTTPCAAEDGQFDSLVQLQQTDYVAPSGSVGVQYDASEAITIGGTFQAPTRVSSTGSLQTRLPPSTMFEGAKVSGDQASMSFTLPATVRAGVEWHMPALRVEAALDVELWSEQDEITFVPQDVRFDNVPVAGSFTLGAMSIPRHYKTTFAPSIGVEYHVGSATFGAGYSYETAAAPTGTVSVLTVDSSKHILGIGGGYDDAGWAIGAAAGIAVLADVDVPLADAQVQQLQPIRDQPQPIAVNAGHYSSTYILAGLRFARRW
ncbi:MAG TPA: outer membrane protein transport protein [Kofleriaceae bacterium]|nr:outer membrane protein transport protein [Kofleriaceae bacterium]